MLRKGVTKNICESGGTGRRARLRGVWLHRTGSSPVSRTKNKRRFTVSCFFANLIKRGLKGSGSEWQSGGLSEPRKTEERSKAEIKNSALRRSDETKSRFSHQKKDSGLDTILSLFQLNPPVSE